MGFSIVIFLYDEMRKWLIRQHPNGMKFFVFNKLYVLTQKECCVRSIGMSGIMWNERHMP